MVLFIRKALVFTRLHYVKKGNVFFQHIRISRFCNIVDISINQLCPSINYDKLTYVERDAQLNEIEIKRESESVFKTNSQFDYAVTEFHSRNMNDIPEFTSENSSKIIFFAT